MLFQKDLCFWVIITCCRIPLLTTPENVDCGIIYYLFHMERKKGSRKQAVADSTMVTAAFHTNWQEVPKILPNWEFRISWDWPQGNFHRNTTSKSSLRRRIISARMFVLSSAYSKSKQFWKAPKTMSHKSKWTTTNLLSFNVTNSTIIWNYICYVRKTKIVIKIQNSWSKLN